MIEIKVRLFSILKEIAAREEFPLPLSQGSSCREAVLRLQVIFGFPKTILEHSLVAVNGIYASRDALLAQGDEMAILPPVSGG